MEPMTTDPRHPQGAGMNEAIGQGAGECWEAQIEAVLRDILSNHFYYNHHTNCFHCKGCDRILNADLEDAEQCSNRRCDWVKAKTLLAERTDA